ncbi:MAG: hypothetical protein GWP91_14440 [Rhodobacterales bacterium]|nr:hypothetical protein [Rhodobacterales bacterium]
MTNAVHSGAQRLQEGAGNAAAVATTGIEAGESWIDSSTDAIWDWLHGEEEQAARGSRRQPRSRQDKNNDNQAPRSGQSPVDPQVCEEDFYLDQRDNESGTTTEGRNCSGNIQCTPTSTTMALLGLISESEFRAKAQTLFLERGVDNGTPWFQEEAPETIVWDYIYARSVDEWSAVLGWQIRQEPHKMADCQAVLIEEFSGASASVRGTWDAGVASCQDNLQQIERFPAVAGTNMLGGHTVTVVSIESDGVVVHDPYGAWLGASHLKNGETGQAPPEHRWRHNSALVSSHGAAETRSDWGASNFFTWAEVAEVGVGKWIAGADESSDIA